MSDISKKIIYLASQPNAPAWIKEVEKELHDSHFCPDGRRHYWGFWSFITENATCKRCGHYEWTRNY